MKKLFLILSFSFLLLILLLNSTPKAGSIICSETSVTKECVDITTNKKTLEIHDVYYKNESGKILISNMSIVNKDKIKGSFLADYGIETGVYKVYIDDKNKNIRFNKDGDAFSIKVNYPINLVKDNYIIYNLDENSTLKYSFEKNKINKLITINSLKDKLIGKELLLKKYLKKQRRMNERNSQN